MVDVRLAIDPGDVHVGWAKRLCGVTASGEWTVAECIRMVREEFAMWASESYYGEIIIEEFVLYPGKAKEQAGSSFQTSQLIGALKLIAQDFQIPVVMQSATIKKPTSRQLKARGIPMQLGSIHSKDAQLHLWYRVIRAKELG